MLYSENYFESTACLNEMGAIWVLNKPYQEILLPGLDEVTHYGLLDDTPTWFKMTDQYKLNDFKKNITKRFSLTQPEQNHWEKSKTDFLEACQNCVLKV